MLAWRSLGACLVLGVFYDAPAQVLESEHMLGLLVLGLDAQRVLGEHQGITEYSRLGPKLRAHGSFNARTRSVLEILVLDPSLSKEIR